MFFISYSWAISDPKVKSSTYLQIAGIVVVAVIVAPVAVIYTGVEVAPPLSPNTIQPVFTPEVVLPI